MSTMNPIIPPAMHVFLSFFSLFIYLHCNFLSILFSHSFPVLPASMMDQIKSNFSYALQTDKTIQSICHEQHHSILSIHIILRNLKTDSFQKIESARTLSTQKTYFLIHSNHMSSPTNF